MIQLKFRQFQTDSGDDSAMIQKGIFHEGSTLNHLIMSPLWVRAWLGAHVRQSKFCLWVVRWFSQGSPIFAPPVIMIDTAQNDLINLECSKSPIKTIKMFSHDMDYMY